MFYNFYKLKITRFNINHKYNYRLKQHVQTGPRDGPYRACMKRSDVLHLLQQNYPDANEYDVRRVVTMGFPDAQSDRSTYILGIRPSHPHSTATEMSSATLLVSPVTERISNEVAMLAAENSKLQERVSELEMKLQYLRQSSISLPEIHHQLERLISSDSIIMHGPDTLERLQSFTIDSVLAELHTYAPDLLQLFETLGQTSRNIHGDDLAVEQIKGLVSICTLLNARTQRAKGLQLLIGIMLIARATSKQVKSNLY